VIGGCTSRPEPSGPQTLPPRNDVAAITNRQFLSQQTFDPWILRTTDPARPVDVYLADGWQGLLVRADGSIAQTCRAGNYQHNTLVVEPAPARSAALPAHPASYLQTLNLRTGVLTTTMKFSGAKAQGDWNVRMSVVKAAERFWNGRDIRIEGDPEAQQVAHSNLFYLLSSTAPGSDHSIPPMGLSSNVYGGHIFWDADVWMLPALIAQWPEYARSIIAYRMKTLPQAKRNARKHGYQGAEFPWESAATGQEVAPGEFARERHVTAGVAFAAWQFYLWTGDRAFLRQQGWPLLQATADYWASRVTKEADGKYHIQGVLSPDETAGVLDDDAYTNAAAQYNLRAAVKAARILGQPAPALWTMVAEAMFLPFDTTRGIPAPSAKPLTDRYKSKQAATLLLLHPLGLEYDAETRGRMLDFYAPHTIATGPAMTASIHAILAAQLGRGPQSLDYFRDSYRPFMRAPWNAFSEKRTTQNVYFLTGMAGCTQSLLYGFAGLQARLNGEKAAGTRVAGDAEASLYADPHLPPGWSRLVLQGLRFRGKILDLSITPDNRVTVTPQGRR